MLKKVEFFAELRRVNLLAPNPVQFRDECIYKYVVIINERHPELTSLTLRVIIDKMIQNKIKYDYDFGIENISAGYKMLLQEQIKYN